MNTIRKVLPIRQVAEFLQMSSEAACRVATDGALQGHRIGRIRRFPEKAIRKYLREHGSHDAEARSHDAPWCCVTTWFIR